MGNVKQRANGEGTYFLDPGPKNDPTRWRITVTIAGCRHSRIVYGKEADAKRKLKELLKAKDERRNVQA